MNLSKIYFNSSNGQQLDIKSVVAELTKFLKDDSGCFYKIIIGTDSKIGSDLQADFVTAVVVHRVGKGGRYFWRRIDPGKKFHTLRDRIWEEVIYSLEIAKNMFSELQRITTSKYDFEVHVDIGTKGATKALIQEVTGMIRATQFSFKTKPDSYAASSVADRHV